MNSKSVIVIKCDGKKLKMIEYKSIMQVTVLCAIYIGESIMGVN